MGKAREDLESPRRVLERWGDTEEYIRRKEAEIQEYAKAEAMALDMDSVGARVLDGQPRGTGGVLESPVERALAAAEERVGWYRQMQVDIQGDIDDRKRLKREIDRLVDRLPQRFADVLKHRFQDRMEWQPIADVMGYEMRHVQQLEYDAVERIAGCLSLGKQTEVLV